ncbi:apolipoprotein N-acyltransferase [Actinomadura sp. SCN-SB]|uniref:apolipoprotein N-acyltransferase n=1 Tax=Actinomadura sp. SCN-SB TaxID=3373092 RepID=UPI0037539852
MLTFPRPGLSWLAWVILVPGLLLMRSAPGVRAAGVRGWWFGAGYLMAVLYWTLPNIGPGLVLVAVVFGLLWAAWGAAARWLGSSAVAVIVLPSIWVAIEYARSWPSLGGPWGLLGVSQWSHPTILSLASIGGVWLLSFVLVAANTAIVLAVRPPQRGPWVRAGGILLALLLLAAGPLTYAARTSPPTEKTMRVALVQPGVVHNPPARFSAGERITAQTPPADLIVWGESSVGHAIARTPDIAARLRALAAQAPILVNEDARDAEGRISESAILMNPDGTHQRYVKTRLVPFGEYIPFRSGFGWLSRISRAAGQDRVPGTGATVMTTHGLTLGPLICFESTFPDLGRAVVRRGAQLLVYQSSTSTFQGSWAPPQHASLVAVRAAETGRPAVQAALSGVSTAFDARGRRLAWMDTDRRGSTVVTLHIPPSASRTPYDRLGDYVAYLAALIAAATALAAARGRLAPPR